MSMKHCSFFSRSECGVAKDIMSPCKPCLFHNGQGSLTAAMLQEPAQAPA